MALTYPAAFLFDNAADDAVITVPGSLTLTPPSRLQNPHTSVRCRVEADTMAITVALAAAITGDTFGLFGSNLTVNGITRIRASLTDTSAVDGAVYDSGSAAGRVSAYYGNLVGLMETAASLKYVRFDQSEAGIAYTEGGFVMIGRRRQVETNFAHGASDTPIDNSIKTKSRSGATHIDDRPKTRKWNFDFQLLSETERMGWVEDLDQTRGSSRNVMVIRNCASSDLGRDTLCGLITQGSKVISRDGFIGDAPAYSKSYEIEERK